MYHLFLKSAPISAPMLLKSTPVSLVPEVWVKSAAVAAVFFIIDLVLFVIAFFMSLKVDILHFLYVLAH